MLLGLAAFPTLSTTSVVAGSAARVGTFKGKKGHVTTGSVEVHGDKVILGADFFFDGAPDPKLAFGKNGYDASTLMGPLKSNSGASSYAIPTGINPEDYNEVWIWCEKFNVPLGLATLGSGNA
jgi:hypothetical protein